MELDKIRGPMGALVWLLPISGQTWIPGHWLMWLVGKLVPSMRNIGIDVQRF